VNARVVVSVVEPSRLAPPRVRAFQAGVPIDRDRAVIEIDGTFGVVDLRSGSLLEMTDLARPAMGPCELLPMLDDVLAICGGKDDAWIIAGLRRLRPSVERHFDHASTFYAGEPGTLMKDGPCDRPAGPRERPSVCLREPSGKWKTVGPDPGAADGEKQGESADEEPAFDVIRWVPTRDADAVGIVLGERRGLYRARSGKLVEFTDRKSAMMWDYLKSHAGLLDDDFEVAPNGHLVGTPGLQVVDLAPDGKLRRIERTTLAAESRGRYAVARAAHGRAWQSTNHGFTWEPVNMPPGSSNLQVTSCSYAGCLVNGWYRIGYPVVPPKQWVPAVPPHSPVPAPQTQALLACQTEGKGRQRAVAFRKAGAEWPRGADALMGARAITVAPKKGQYDPVKRFDFTSPLHSAHPTVLAETLLDFPYDNPTDPMFRRAISQRRLLQFQVPFTDPKLAEASIVWGDVIAAFRRQVQLMGWTPENTPFEVGLHGIAPGIAVPVLSTNGKRSDGLLLLAPSDTPRFAVWVRANQPPKVFALSPHRTLAQPYSVVARPDGNLAAAGLVHGSSEVLLLSPEPSAVLSAPLPRDNRPPRPDVVAIREDGALGLVRIWSTGVPTRDDPALVFRVEGPPIVLAPWSTLTAGPCGDGPGYRAIVNVQDWVGLEIAGRRYTLDGDGLALVHWNQERVCVSAIEVPHAILNGEQGGAGTATAQARFDQRPSAVRYRFGMGEEYVEELRCRLVPE
jgi:hypothetical protein